MEIYHAIINSAIFASLALAIIFGVWYLIYHSMSKNVFRKQLKLKRATYFFIIEFALLIVIDMLVYLIIYYLNISIFFIGAIIISYLLHWVYEVYIDYKRKDD